MVARQRAIHSDSSGSFGDRLPDVRKGVNVVVSQRCAAWDVLDPEGSGQRGLARLLQELTDSNEQSMFKWSLCSPESQGGACGNKEIHEWTVTCATCSSRVLRWLLR